MQRKPRALVVAAGSMTVGFAQGRGGGRPGGQGGGKTRLSLALGRKLDLPVIHLDVLYWRPGWKPSDKADFRKRVADAIAGDRWIVDGSFSGLAMDLTIARADLFVAIERPRWLRMWRVLMRSISSATRGGAICRKDARKCSTGCW